MVLGTAVTASACDQPRALGRAPTGVRGKRELFGDPALVPTRAGERARAELALADAVAGALRALGAAELAVEVRLPDGDDPGAVVVAGQAPPGWGEAAAKELVRELCGAWSGPVLRVAWRGEASPGADAPTPIGARLPLFCALVGLGASAGVTLDRLRRRRSRLGYTWPR